MYFSDTLYELAKAFRPTSLYVVGGAVRDMLSGKDTKDVDIASALTPDEVADKLSDSGFTVQGSAKKLGTLIIRKDGEKFEYTAFRKDSYPDGSGQHSPDSVVFTKNIDEDCLRRDFRCNAIYYDLSKDSIYDPLGGEEDVKNRILRTTRRAEQVFAEDGLRIMRLFRFISVLGFEADEDAIKVCAEEREKLRDVSAERIRDELDKLLTGQNVVDALRLMRKTGVLQVILPELAENGEVEQPAAFHAYDALEHAFMTVAAAPDSIRLAALLHDVGKAEAIKKDGNMHYHAIYGAQTAERIMQRLKYPKAFTAKTVRLVREHMYDIYANAKPAKLRKFVAANHDIADELIALVRADSLGTGKFTDSPRAQRFTATLEDMKKKNVPFEITQLKINGNDVKAAGFTGKDIGRILDTARDMCIQYTLANERKQLLSFVARTAKKEGRQ